MQKYKKHFVQANELTANRMFLDTFITLTLVLWRGLQKKSIKVAKLLLVSLNSSFFLILAGKKLNLPSSPGWGQGSNFGRCVRGGLVQSCDLRILYKHLKRGVLQTLFRSYKCHILINLANKIPWFDDFLHKNQLLPIFYTQNCIFGGSAHNMTPYWRHTLMDSTYYGINGKEISISIH